MVCGSTVAPIRPCPPVGASSRPRGGLHVGPSTDSRRSASGTSGRTATAPAAAGRVRGGGVLTGVALPADGIPVGPGTGSGILHGRVSGTRLCLASLFFFSLSLSLSLFLPLSHTLFAAFSLFAASLSLSLCHLFVFPPSQPGVLVRVYVCAFCSSTYVLLCSLCHSILLSPFIYLSIHSSFYLSICLSLFLYLFLYVSIYPYIYLFIYLSISLFLYVYPSIHLSIHPSIYLSICLSIYPSIYLSIYLSIFISICQRNCEKEWFNPSLGWVGSCLSLTRDGQISVLTFCPTFPVRIHECGASAFWEGISVAARFWRGRGQASLV